MICLSIVVAGLFVVTGIWGLLQRKPVVIRSKYLSFFIVFMAVALLVQNILVSGAQGSRSFFGIFVQIGLMVIAWKIFKGISIFGAGQEDILQSLGEAVTKMGLTSTEKLGAIELSDGSLFLVSLNNKMDTGQISPGNQTAERLTPRLAKHLKAALTSGPNKFRSLIFWAYMLLGIFMTLPLIFILIYLPALMP